MRVIIIIEKWGFDYKIRVRRDGHSPEYFLMDTDPFREFKNAETYSYSIKNILEQFGFQVIITNFEYHSMKNLTFEETWKYLKALMKNTSHVKWEDL